MLAALRELRRLPLAELVAHLGERIEDYYEGASPADDLTILALRRNEQPWPQAEKSEGSDL